MNKNKQFSQNFLTKIAEIESRGGKNVEHQPADPKSMHVGSTAVGKYGLMPLTVQDIVASNPDDADLSELKEFTDFNKVGNPNVAALKQLGMSKYIKANPMIEELLANKLKQQIEGNVKGDEQMGAVAWHAGSGASPMKIKAMLKEHGQRGSAVRDYLNKFKKLEGMEEDVPFLEPDPKAIPSMLGIMTSRPSVEDLMTEQSEEELRTGPWAQIKEYLDKQYNRDEDEE